jgi:hypothetical protein
VFGTPAAQLVPFELDDVLSKLEVGTAFTADVSICAVPADDVFGPPAAQLVPFELGSVLGKFEVGLVPVADDAVCAVYVVL